MTGARLVLALWLSSAAAGRAGAQQASPDTAPVLRLAYGADTTQFGQLRLPRGAGPHPVVVVIHGGCFLARLGVSHVSQLSSALTRLGAATWAIEFRRVGSPGGGWPGTWRDVADATDHLRVLAPRHRLDTSRVVILGHSSGGNLALWAATRSRLPRGSPLSGATPLRPAAAVVLDSHLDLRYYEDLLYPTGTYHCRASVLPRLIGARADEVPDRFRQVSPFALLPTGVHQVLVFSPPRDPELSHLLTRHDGTRYAARNYPVEAKAAGDSVEVVVVPEADHSDFTKRGSPAFSETERIVRRLLRLDDTR